MFKKKNLKNTLGIIVICILASVCILGVVGKVTDGFQDFEIREVNEDNLINVDNYAITLEDKRTDGLKVEVNDDGVIAITGKNETDSDVEIEVCSVTLKADEYTLSCEARGIDDKTYYLVARTGTGDDIEEIVIKNDKSKTFEVKTETTFTIYIVVCDGEKVDTTFKPVLVEGKEVGSFYVLINK